MRYTMMLMMTTTTTMTMMMMTRMMMSYDDSKSCDVPKKAVFTSNKYKITDYRTDWFPDVLRPYFPYAERYMWPITSIAQTVTIWTVLLVTVDRYMAVCRPFDTRMRSVNCAKKFFVGVVVAAIVYNIPRFLEHQVVVERNTCTKQVTTSPADQYTTCLKNSH